MVYGKGTREVCRCINHSFVLVDSIHFVVIFLFRSIGTRLEAVDQLRWRITKPLSRAEQ